MVNVQEVFNEVIDKGFYNETDNLMCHSLKEAARAGVITSEQFVVAKSQITDYLSGFGSLGGYLDYKGREYDFKARLAVYKDWANKN